MDFWHLKGTSGFIFRFVAALLVFSVTIRAQVSPGNAVVLNGTDYVRTTTWSHELFNSESFTFEFWFNANAPGVLLNEADTVSASAWDIAFAEVITGGIIKAGVPGVPTLTVGTVAFGSWHHLVLTYNQTNQTFTAYLDGAPAGNSVGNRQSPADISRTSVYCFGRGGPANLGPGGFLSGKFDEVRIWRRAFTADDVAATWNTIRSTDGADLMGLWHLDSTNGSQSPDSRPGGNNPAWYVPVTSAMPLVSSTIPVTGPPPSITTLSAIVSDTSVTLRGTAYPQGVSVSGYFEWGSTIAYGSQTSPQALGSGNSDVLFTAPLNALAPGAYHYRAVILTPTATIRGTDLIFTILGPTVVTQVALVTNQNARLQATANPKGYPISGHFEWGTTPTYGNSTPPLALGSGTSDVLYSELLTNLAQGEYHFRVVVTSTNGAVYGDDQTFVIAGTAGYAARVTGNDYLRTTTWSDTLFTDETFTFELWFNATGPGELINEADTSNPTAWDFAFAEVFPGGVIKAGVPGVPTFTVGTVAFGTWHHLALVYDGNAKLLSAYLDGQPAGSSAGDRNTPKEIGRTSIYCFGRGGHSNLGGGNWLSGVLDEIRIWRRALPASEITANFDRILLVTDPTLMANWHLDSIITGQNHLSPDSSGKNNHAWHVPESVAMPLVGSGAPIRPDLRPIVTTPAFLNITPEAIQFSGSVNPRGTNTLVYFEYGSSNMFQTSLVSDIGQGDSPVNFNSVVSGLAIGDTNILRLIASNAFGVVRSVDVAFVKTGWAGYAYQFTPNDYVRTAVSQNSYFATKSITVETWFYPTKTGVIASETTVPPNPNFDRSIIEILASGSVQAGFNGLTPITVGEATFNHWNHVALRYDHTTQTMEGFLNGVKGPSRAGVRVTPAEIGFNGHFAFGRTAIIKLGPGEYFGGRMDEIRVWNIARSDEDLSSARLNLLAGDEPGLVLNWRFGAVASEPVLDNSPRGNIGTNFGAEPVVSGAPLIYGVRRIDGGQIETQFVAALGSSYRLEASNDLVNWSSISTHVVPTNGFIRIPRTIESNQTAQFFRIVPQP